jgi:glycosyltransferase involved in cell wall biosynthesis
VVVIAPSQTGKPYTEVDGNYTIYRTRSVIFPFYQNIRISLTPLLEIRKIIQNYQPDVIHTQIQLGIGQASMSLARRYDIPVVSTSHAMPENLMDNLKKLAPLARPINYMLQEYGRIFHSRADAITSPTKSGLQSLGKAIDKVETPIYTISNGIDLKQYSPTKPGSYLYEKFSIPKDVPLISYVGRIDAEKHLWVLIKAMKRIAKISNAHLVVVGSGGDLECSQELAKDLGIRKRITFTGRVDSADLVELQKIGNVFCMPSPVEIQSIATLEAMASGQPVVAVDAGALAELCHDKENGFLFDLDDDKMAADGILKIISNPVLRKKMSAASLKIAKTHNIVRTLEQFENLYKIVIEQKLEK